MFRVDIGLDFSVYSHLRMFTLSLISKSNLMWLTNFTLLVANPFCLQPK
jgi:hypothetical protein